MGGDPARPIAEADDHASCADALRASEARFRAVIEKNGDGMVVVGRDGTILFANPAAESLLGRPRDSLVGNSFGHPIVPGEIVELDVVCSESTLCVAEMRVVETDWDGHPAVLASLRDVTDRKRLEDELSHRVAELAEANQQKNTFLAMLAHELRNPLAPVRNAAEVLRLKPDDAEALAWAREMIELQVGHIARLVDDLLDVSRITRGKVQLRRTRLLLDDVVSKAVEAARPSTRARGLELVLIIENSGIVLDADTTRIEQILSNLLNNAAKFSQAGGHVLVRVDRDGNSARLAVEDNGIGIDRSMLERVFDLFAQADGSLDRASGGLGIGLTLVKSLVELHGGNVRAESDGLGTGSRFIVTLPASDQPISNAPILRESPSPRADLRVLIVDDNFQAAESLGLLLKLWGYESQLAHDGLAALDVAESYRPDIVLLDIGLPKLDGYEVAQRLRHSNNLSTALLVAMTGYGQDEDRRKTKLAGFDHHMVKPVNLDELRNLLAKPESLRSGTSRP